MQQKKIGNILYVFDVTPYQITQDTDATTIKVQQEVVAGFKELNESLADKIVAYNYHVACVNVPEWAPYVDQDDSEVTITLNAQNLTSENVTVMYNREEVQLADSYTCHAGETLKFYLLENPIYYTASNMSGYDDIVGQEHWWYSVVNEDDTIGLTYTDPASTITLTAPFGLSIFDEDSHDWVSMYRDQSDPNIATGALVKGRTYSVEQRHGVGEGKTVVFDPDCGTGEQGTVGTSFIAPDSDLTITLEAQKQTPELAWSADEATVTIGADDNVFPTLTNPHSVTVTYASGDPEYATIDQSTGQITLVAAGSTSIYANFAGDETYEAGNAAYLLTVEASNPE